MGIIYLISISYGNQNSNLGPFFNAISIGQGQLKIPKMKDFLDNCRRHFKPSEIVKS